MMCAKYKYLTVSSCLPVPILQIKYDIDWHVGDISPSPLSLYSTCSLEQLSHVCEVVLFATHAIHFFKEAYNSATLMPRFHFGSFLSVKSWDSGEENAKALL